MSKESYLVMLGVLVALSPFVGVPREIKSWALVVLGIVIAIVALLLRSGRRTRHRKDAKERTQSLPFDAPATAWSEPPKLTRVSRVPPPANPVPVASVVPEPELSPAGRKPRAPRIKPVLRVPRRRTRSTPSEEFVIEPEMVGPPGAP